MLIITITCPNRQSWSELLNLDASKIYQLGSWAEARTNGKRKTEFTRDSVTMVRVLCIQLQRYNIEHVNKKEGRKHTQLYKVVFIGTSVFGFISGRGYSCILNEGKRWGR